MWMLVVLIGFSVRRSVGSDQPRAVLSFYEACYDRTLDFLYGKALGVAKLTRPWTALVPSGHPGLLWCNGRVVLVGDGIKAGKSERKMAAYHRFMQPGLIAQGLMQAPATTVPDLVWGSFGSWLRTVRPGLCPAKLVVAAAMRNCLPDFLADALCAPTLTKFIRDRLDLERDEGTKLVADAGKSAKLPDETKNPKSSRTSWPRMKS